MGAAEAVANEAVVSRAVFAAGGVEYTWGDVVVAARLRGDWDAVERAARHGHAALAVMYGRDEKLAADDLDAAASEFRYARDLLSGDEMEAWLARWDLSSLEWSEWLARTLAREREAIDDTTAGRVEQDEVETATGVEAICSGALEAWARELAARAAVALAADVPPARGADTGADAAVPPARGVLAVAPAAWRTAAAKVAGLDIAPEEVLGGALDAGAVAREVELRRLDWLAFDCRLVVLPEQSMAREALLCLHDDRCSLDEVAARACAEIVPRRLLLEDAPPMLQPALLGAREGDTSGPIPLDGGHAVVMVERKREPDLADPELGERARRLALARVVDREVERRIEWHERV